MVKKEHSSRVSNKIEKKVDQILFRPSIYFNFILDIFAQRLDPSPIKI